MPALPFVFLAVGYVLSRAGRAGALALGAIAMLQLVACWPPVVKRIHTPHGDYFAGSSWKIALRREPEDRYLRRTVAGYPMARLIEGTVPEGQAVFALAEGGVPQSYTSRPIVNSYHSAQAERAVDLFYGNAEALKNGGRRWTAAFPKVKARQLQISQSGRSANVDVMWSVDEVRLWRGGECLSPARSWREDASPNPWDIGLAFDGAEGTRWKSWESIRPGMSIGVLFDTPVSIDRVDVVSLDPQWDSHMDLGILADAGRWLHSPGAWQTSSPVDVRKAATGELKREGVHFVVIRRSAHDFQVFAEDPSAWGMHEAASSEDSILYRID